MNCKRCGSDDIIRSRRRGIWDRIQSMLGQWPYRCESCSYRFTAPYRYPDQAPATRPVPHGARGQEFRAYADSAQNSGPDMHFKTHAERPHAQIVLQADSHEQLNHILIALNQAVNAYQHSSRTPTDAPKPGSQAEATGARH